jgi:glutamyl-tRNA reductase
MNISLMNPDTGHAPAPVCEPSASLLEQERSIRRARPESSGPTVEDDAAAYSASPPHRRHAADMIRGLGGRSAVTLRRELDRFFAARPGLSHGDKAAIARTLSRLRNQLLHHPRSALRAAAVDPAEPRDLLAAAGSLFNLADTCRLYLADPRSPGDRGAR